MSIIIRVGLWINISLNNKVNICVIIETKVEKILLKQVNQKSVAKNIGIIL